MKVEKKFNEKVQDIIFFEGSKESAGERLGVSVEILNEFLEMEEPPNEAVGKGIEFALEEIKNEKAFESERGLSELEEFEEAEGMIDRSIEFFDGQQIGSNPQLENIDEDKTYNLRLQIIKEGEATNLNVPIQGRYLVESYGYESIAWEYFRDIETAHGSQVTINITAIN